MPRNPPASDSAGRLWWQVPALSAIVPVAVLVLLFQQNVPLGCPGRFVYLYSPVLPQRLAAVASAIPIAFILGLGVLLGGAPTTRRRRIGLAMVALGTIAMAAWSYFAPPDHLNQHIFNIHSPSHDGAFVKEALQVDNVCEYLSSFPDRARTTPAEMRGTRVISNPPATTMLALATDRFLQHQPQLRDQLARRLQATMPTETLVRASTVGLAFFWALTGIWALSGIFLYLLCRLFAPPCVAAAFAVCCVISPMTLMFTPGKDPAQLLTVALPLCCWLLAVRRGWVWPAVAAGVVFPLSCLVSLVHFWIAAIVAAATLLDFQRPAQEFRRLLLRQIVPAVAGSVVCALALYAFCQLDLVAVVRAVARSQTEVTRGPNAMPLTWQLLGVPLFLLTAGSAWWTATLWAASRRASASHQRDDTTRFGLRLLVITAIVMLATVAFTNLETPRLWIPFVPLLLLGALSQLAPLRHPTRRLVLLLAATVFIQVTTSALQWSLMDPRESENRLTQERFFD